ncbi:Uncharacterised protein g8757 [Pycnogonum litorale]
MESQISILHFLVVLLTFEGITAISFEEFTVPSIAFTGKTVDLWCSYSFLDNTKKLYFLKWYKDDVNFYSYIPEAEPDKKKYEVSGVNVDLAQSYKGHVHLIDVTLETAGHYKCHISEDKPHFRSKPKEKKLIVYALPKKPPRIEGFSNYDRPGDLLHLNCTSGPSFPSAELRWFINEEQIPSHALRKQNVINVSGGQYSSVLELSIKLQKSHFINNIASIRCLATVGGYYNNSTEIKVIAKPKASPNKVGNKTPRTGEVGQQFVHGTNGKDSISTINFVLFSLIVIISPSRI